MNPASKKGLSWVEVLVLVTVLGILAAVFVPTVGTIRCGGGRRSIDASNIRQLGQAALIYANDNRDQLPGLSLNQKGEIEDGSLTPNIHSIAAALARYGGLNDPHMWVSASDRHPAAKATSNPILRGPHSERSLCPDFAQAALSYQFIAGLNSSMPSTTPISFTRGLQPDGDWAKDRSVSVFGPEGGHIVFLGGNVAFYRDLREDGGRLLGLNEARTVNMLETISSDQRIYSNPATPTGAINGMPGNGVQVSKTK